MDVTPQPRGRVVLLLAVAIAAGSSVSTHAQSQTAFEHGWQSGRPMAVTGELVTLVADDFANGRSEKMHFIRDARTGRSFRIHLDREAPAHWRTGNTITIEGRGNDAEVYVLAAATDPAATLSNPQATVSGEPRVTGDQRTLVMIANFTNAAVSCSADAINNVVFADPNGASVDRLYREASLDRVSFSGQVVGPFFLPYSNTDTCDIGAWADATNAQAAATGVDLSAYPRKVYVMPPNSCAAAGYGTVGGATSGAWVFNCGLKGVYAHELGHNLGLDHASTPTSEYADTTDPMAVASSSLRGLNAPHRDQMGWLEPASKQAVNQDGTYDLAPLALDPAMATAPQVITMAKPDTGELYTLSYRTSQGFDANIDWSYLGKLSVHRFHAGSTRTYRVGALADGESFEDAANGINVRLVSHDTNHATVEIRFVATCTASAPSISFSPQSLTAAPGDELTYQVDVTNRDALACPPSTLMLQPAVPSGWAASISPSDLTLAPGTTGQASLSVRSTTDALPAVYSIGVATHDASSVHSSSATASYTVVLPCIPNAPSISLLPSSQTGAAGSVLSYAIQVTNRDSVGCQATTLSLASTKPAGWTGGMSPSAMTLLPGGTATAVLSLGSASVSSVGTYTVLVRVEDVVAPAHGSSAQVDYIVTAPCLAAPPAVNVSPSTQEGAAGTTRAYTIQVLNRDSGPCAAAALSTRATLPAGWSSTASPAGLTLAPGQSGAVVLAITSSPSASSGPYAITATVFEGQSATHTASTELTYSVPVPADTAPPTAPTSLTASVSQRQKQIRLSWGAATDNVGVTGYRVLRNGVIVATATSTNWIDTAYVAGASYSYAIQAYDLAGNVSAVSNSVSVTLSSGGGGSGGGGGPKGK